MLSINPVYDAVGNQMAANVDLYGPWSGILVVVDHFEEHSTPSQYRLNHNMNRDIRKSFEPGMNLYRTLIEMIRPHRILEAYISLHL